MRVLITGASGFAGCHLVRHLTRVQPDAQLYGTFFSAVPPQVLADERYVQLDLCDYDAVLHLLQQVQPDVIYNLAGQASAKRSFERPWHTLETNLRIQFNVLQACVDVGVAARIIAVTSSEIYGANMQDTRPLTEDRALRPTSPYSLSKSAQDLMSLQYHLAYKLPIVRARPFNHIGPRQSASFVAPDFALQIARIEAGISAPVMQVGNLSAKRDFTDVRDVVRAYQLLAEHGEPGEAYNVASNQMHSIQELLDTLLSLTPAKIDVQVDAAKLRPVDVPYVRGDYTRLQQATGWQPQISLRQSLADLLADCRQRLQASSPN